MNVRFYEGPMKGFYVKEGSELTICINESLSAEEAQATRQELVDVALHGRRCPDVVSITADMID